MIKFEVQDTLTEYLDKLKSHFNANKVTLNEVFAEAVVGDSWMNPRSGHIAKYMSTNFNPYLFASGQDKGYWKFMSEEGISSIEVMYSGMHLHEQYPVGKARVWWEFAEDTSAPKNQRKLARDYAWYQETGEDKIAMPEDARHKGAIAKGLAEVSQKDLKKTEEYFMRIMELKFVQGGLFIGSKR